jgi:hypothetical protein
VALPEWPTNHILWGQPTKIEGGLIGFEQGTIELQQANKLKGRVKNGTE